MIKNVSSNRMNPNLTTNYTKIIFKDRLEVLECFKGIESDYPKVLQMYQDIIQISAQYYDIILIDLGKGRSAFSETILNSSDVIVYGIDQRMTTINEYSELMQKTQFSSKQNTLLYCGKYQPESKYNVKNITRYLKARQGCLPILNTTLYTEAMEEGNVVDYFLKMRTVKSEDKNVQFMNNIQELSNSIIYKIKEQQMNR